jgi:hypothetical protein
MVAVSSPPRNQLVLSQLRYPFSNVAYRIRVVEHDP